MSTDTNKEEAKKQFAVLDKDGKVVCVDVTTLVLKDISEVDVDQVFTCWCCSEEELAEYLKQFEDFGEENPFKNFSLEGISFLEVSLDIENNEVIFG